MTEQHLQVCVVETATELVLCIDRKEGSPELQDQVSLIPVPWDCGHLQVILLAVKDKPDTCLGKGETIPHHYISAELG